MTDLLAPTDSLSLSSLSPLTPRLPGQTQQGRDLVSLFSVYLQHTVGTQSVLVVWINPQELPLLSFEAQPQAPGSLFCLVDFLRSVTHCPTQAALELV